MVSATRVTRARTPLSRSGVPSVPCRYLLATILVAVTDQSFGTSTSFCSKIGLPLASVIRAVRFSHSISSYGETPSLVKKRRKERPAAFLLGVAAFTAVALGTAVVSGAGAPFSLTSAIFVSSFLWILSSFLWILSSSLSLVYISVFCSRFVLFSNSGGRFR